MENLCEQLFVKKDKIKISSLNWLQLTKKKKQKKNSIQWFQLKKIHNRKKSKNTTIEWILKKIVEPMTLVIILALPRNEKLHTYSLSVTTGLKGRRAVVQLN